MYSMFTILTDYRLSKLGCELVFGRFLVGLVALLRRWGIHVVLWSTGVLDS